MKIQYFYPNNCFSIPLLKFDRQSLSSRVIAILDLTNGSLTLFTKKCKMLHCNPRMKITSEKKGIFHILFTRYEQKISVRAISITIDSKFPSGVSIINKRKKIHIINISNYTLYIVKLVIGFDTLFWANFCRFSERGCRFMR